jgi:hypothetical protein
VVAVSDADHTDPPTPSPGTDATGGPDPLPHPTEYDALHGYEDVPNWALAAIALGLTVLTGSMLLLALASIAAMYCWLALGDERSGVRRRSASRPPPGSPGRSG